MPVNIKQKLKRAFAILPSSLQEGVKFVMDSHAIRVRHHLACRKLVQDAAGISDSCLLDMASRVDWAQRRPMIRRQLSVMLGLDHLPERGPLNVAITGVVERPAYQIEKIVFESVPGLYVTGNFYLPRNRTGLLPCVVYLNGHWPSLDGAKIGFQDRYLWYPVNGFALLVLDPMGFGEIPGIHPGTNRHNQWHWLSLGYTPAGVEVWNAMRALDWLENRSEIDSAKIGVTGVSGGGVMTQYLAALDDRVAVAAPSCSTYTIGNQAGQALVSLQCDCTFYPNVFRIDFPEVLALIAPRPLLILGGRKDPIFPPAGFRAAFQRTKKIYEYFAESGSADPRIRLVESGQGHTDPPHFLDETHRWMSRWLRPLDGREGVTEVPNPESPETLRCVVDIPHAALNYSIHDVWIKTLALAVPEALAGWERRKEILLDHLRTRVFCWFPAAEIPFRTRRFFASGGYAGACSEFGEFEFDSEPGVPVKACVLKPRGRLGPVPLIIWVKGPSNHVVFPDLDEFFPVLRSHALVILTPRFSDQLLSGADYARVERTAAIAGRSVASMRVWDVMRAVKWATRDCGIDASRITVFGTGGSGIAGLYAAVLEPVIGQVILRDAPCSHLAGAALPMIMRETDILEVAGLLVPRRLMLLGQGREAFTFTRSIYALAGAAAAIGHPSSLAEALFEADVTVLAKRAGEGHR